MDQVSSKSPFDFLRDDFFIDEILSRVHTAQSIVRLGMASKRFHSLCSYPCVLEFKEVPANVGFIKYLDKFFEFRMKKSNMKHEFRRLQICLPEKMNLPIVDFVTVHLLGWFHKALSLNVHELILRFNGKQVGSDPYLERPQLNLQYYSNPLKHLRVLTLEDIPIALNEGFEDWILISCVSLEKLNLSDVLVLPTKLTITSSSLRVFTIKGHFEELNVVSVPKLVTLHVTWSRINLNGQPFIKISDAPNLEDFLLENWDASYNSLRYGSSVDINFPSLKSATVRFSEKAYLFSYVSMERLLHDISQTRHLCLSDTILHQISRHGILYYATLFHKLDKLHVCIKRSKKSRWWQKVDTIMSFVKSIPSLKTFKLTIKDDHFDAKTVQGCLQNAFFFNVEELDLQLEKNKNNYNYIDVPELKLHYYHYHLKHHQHLRVLTLKDIPIGLNHSFEDWVSTCCVNLEELNLTGVLVFPDKLRIASSSLRVFTIDAHFKDLHVSAPKLVTLHVTWNLVYHGKHEKSLSLKVSDSPNVEDFLLSNWHTSLPLEYDNYCRDKSNFPSLKSATVLILVSNISPYSFKRLLLDISQTRKLCVSDTILHKISCSEIIHLAKLHVRVGAASEKQSSLEKAQAINTFVNKVPSLTTFKLTTENNSNDHEVYDSNWIRKVLVGNAISRHGISRPIVYLDDDEALKVVVGPEDDAMFLLHYIIRRVPREMKFIFLCQR